MDSLSTNSKKNSGVEAKPLIVTPMAPNESYVCKLSAEIQEKAKRELNEEPERRSQSLEIIKEWIKQQPHLNAKTDDVYLLRFLRNCKYSLELTKEKIDRFYTMRSALPEWYTNRDPLDPKIIKLLDLGIYLILPGYDKEGRKVTLYRIGAFNPSTVDINDLHKVEQMFVDVLLDDEQLQVSGICSLCEVSGFTGAHLAHWNIPLAKKQMTIWQTCNPIRLKSINVFNESAIFHSLMEMFKFFIKEKLKKRIVFHGKNLKSVHKVIPKEMLPIEYGGTAGTVQDLIDYTKKQFINRRKIFMEEEKFGVDETKRPGKPRTQEDLFGVDGSFRKLNID